MTATRERNRTKLFQLRNQNSDGASSKRTFGSGVFRQREYELMEVSHAKPKVEWCFTRLSTVFQSYHGDSSHYSCLSWVSPVLGWGSEVSCPRKLPPKNPDDPVWLEPRIPRLRVKHFTTEPRRTPVRSQQAWLKYKDKHIPVDYDTSTGSYFSDSESDN